MTMKTTTILLCAALLLGACGGNAARNRKSAAATRITVPAAPREYTYRVKAVHPHATDAYTQGLQYVDGTLWEGTGQHGASRVTKTDLGTDRTELFARLPRSEFGEGITLLDGRLYYLTWQSNTAHVYDARRDATCATSATRARGGGSRPTASGSTSPTARSRSTCSILRPSAASAASR